MRKRLMIEVDVDINAEQTLYNDNLKNDINRNLDNWCDDGTVYELELIRDGLSRVITDAIKNEIYKTQYTKHGQTTVKKDGRNYSVAGIETNKLIRNCDVTVRLMICHNVEDVS